MLFFGFRMGKMCENRARDVNKKRFFCVLGNGCKVFS